MTTPTGRTVRRGAALTLCTGLAMGLITSALVAPAQAADDDAVGIQPVPQPTSEPATQQLAAGVIYKMRDGYSPTASAKGLSAAAGVASGVAIGTTTTPVDAADTAAVDFAEPVSVATAAKAAAAVAANPAVEWAEPNYIATTAQSGPVTPKDQYFKKYQWNVWDYRNGSVSNVAIPKGGWSAHALNMWPRTQGGGVVVAVVDTGITKHFDLNPNVVAGYDMISSAASARDGNGRDANPLDNGDLAGYQGGSTWHGTHVAGIVAAARGTTGMAGVAPNAKIQPVRVLGKGGGTFGDIAAGITWASGGAVSGTSRNATPAKVINLSIQTQADVTCPRSLQTAITNARKRGAVVITAAGNYNKTATLSAPGNCAGVINVGAIDRNGKRSSYSNKGSAVDLSAPGGSGSGTSLSGYVWSTINAGTTSPGKATWGGMAGTSQAAPAVAGAAALIASLGVKGAALEQAVQKIVSPFPRYSGSSYNCSTSLCGRGYLDISKALVPLGQAKVVGTPAAGKVVKGTVAKGFVGKVTKKKFQWYRNGVAIKGATSQSYKVTAADRGKWLKVRVTPVSTGSYWAKATYSAGVKAR
ncbi:S8 family serine peptidase [Cellulomonas sp. DKR-3]|uniref:S8 family serine peptidase n=1 Tax=Cellulomonas fulva TaxID=2835530 RepID=A0ABS5U1C2_9CELL|nr:S8 family serine peptidase [Cellulomonas fulva]MBT0995182.1 S8 family serine peptidase [Cellulomonas fulva]